MKLCHRKTVVLGDYPNKFQNVRFTYFSLIERQHLFLNFLYTLNCIAKKKKGFTSSHLKMILNKQCHHVIFVVENYGNSEGHLAQACKYQKSREMIFMNLESFSQVGDVPAHLDLHIMFLLQCLNTQQSQNTLKESHLNKFINGLQYSASD